MNFSVLLLHILHFFGVITYTAWANERNKRSIIGRYPICPHGCSSCSSINGCVTCQPRLFILLIRHSHRQTGVCTHSCPAGYYGIRRHGYSRCHKCNIKYCEACYNRHYCTRCKEPYISYRGKCIDACPEGLHYASYAKDCKNTVDCMAGPWSSWGFCARGGQTCGYRNGVKVRSRQILEFPSKNGVLCPPLSHTRRCRMQLRVCEDLETNESELTVNNARKRRRKHKNKKSRKKYKRRRRRKNKRRNRRKNRRRRRKRKHRRRKTVRPEVQTNDFSALILKG